MVERGLRSFDFQPEYRRTTSLTLLAKFFVPMLERSTTYDRITGYFSSAILASASAGFSKFCSSENTRDDEAAKFRLIIGAKLGHKDEATLRYLQGRPPEGIAEGLIDTIESIAGEEDIDFSKGRIRGLAWMIKHNLLEMKVAVRFDEENKRYLSHSEAEFHSKIGIASDGVNNLAFEGSVNETQRGWVKNYETMAVYRDWEIGETERVLSRQKLFERLWAGNGPVEGEGVAIYSFPDAAAKKLLEQFPPSPPAEIDELSQAEQLSRAHNRAKTAMNGWRRDKPVGDTTDEVEPEPSIWDLHQNAAISWFFDSERANGIGVFQMATGSGKTRTAIKCMRKLILEDQVNRLVVSAPNHLIEQWKDAIEETNTGLGYAYGGKGLLSALYFYTSGKKEHLAWSQHEGGRALILVSHSILQKFLKSVKSFDLSRSIIIVDEMHRAGAERFLKMVEEAEQKRSEPHADSTKLELDELEASANLYSQFTYRLGLSATPWATFDFENRRNRFLVSNFTRQKDTSENFFAGDWKRELIDKEKVFFFGLKDGIERGILSSFEYIPLNYEPSEEEKQRYDEWIKRGFGAKNEDGSQNMLGAIRAAAEFKGSREKIPVFMSWLDENPTLKRTVIFVEDRKFGEALLNRLSEKGFDRVTKFFQDDPDWNLLSFTDENVDFIVACHRISEGWDTNNVDRIVLFSSSTARLETIQRIGRALRIRPGANKRAQVVDFIYDNLSSTTNPDVLRRDWLASLAESKPIE